mmetsp:Transcript_29705/g.78845  ORF Transcript_29705/g.78845 Transcript_29705/m.78845 type:complete len:287 (-) Transcript_29705:53-913(-)
MAWRLCVILSGFAAAEEGCTITAALCQNFPDFKRTQFRDSVGELRLDAGSNDAMCFKRAEDFHAWCGNDRHTASVAATFNPSGITQVYHPSACDEGWSQWDAFCYKHVWEKRTWFEAEALCREKKSHLASIHSKAENRFIYALTSGLSAWIGYTDLDEDTHYQWSDSTQDDFSNFAKNCTGREDEPDCQPEEQQQQWYDWNGGDAGTYVCKRNALLPVTLLQNVSAVTLTKVPWDTLSVGLVAPAKMSSSPVGSVALRTDDLPLPLLGKVCGQRSEMPLLLPKLSF